MQLDQIPDDIFHIFNNTYDVDFRVLRLISHRFEILPKSGINILDSFILTICKKEHNLARWYYEQVNKGITLETLTNHCEKFVFMYYNHIPLYVLEDHPQLSTDAKHIIRYIRILGIERYFNMAKHQVTPFLSNNSSLQHNLACELVHNCRTSAQTYLVYVMLVGYFNAPRGVTGPFTSNVEYSVMSKNQIDSLSLLALCHQNSDNYESVSRLYAYNKCKRSESIEAAYSFVQGYDLSYERFISRMMSVYDDLQESGLDTTLIYPIYEIYIINRIGTEIF
jgi:hypothetical protein